MLTTSVLALLLGGVTLAALPPLDPSELRGDASHILIVEIEQIYETKRTRRPGFIDRLHLHQAKVGKVEKGAPLALGSLVYAHAWTASERPDGWAGPGGIRGLPGVGEVVRLFLRSAPDGRLSILDPNGVERLQQRSGTVTADKSGTKLDGLKLIASHLVSAETIAKHVGASVKVWGANNKAGFVAYRLVAQ